MKQMNLVLNLLLSSLYQWCHAISRAVVVVQFGCSIELHPNICQNLVSLMSSLDDFFFWLAKSHEFLLLQLIQFLIWTSNKISLKKHINSIPIFCWMTTSRIQLKNFPFTATLTILFLHVMITFQKSITSLWNCSFIS